MTLSFFRLFFCFALSIINLLPSANTLAFAEDSDPPYIKEMYIYDSQCQFKESLDSSTIILPKRLLADCQPIDLSRCDTKTASELPPDSTVKRERSPYRSGKEGEEQVIQVLKDKGAEVLGREITLKTSTGTTTRVDMIIRNAQNSLEVIEVKNGMAAKLSSNQKDTFPLIQREGAKHRGSKVDHAKIPEQIGPTLVRVIRVMVCKEFPQS